MEEIPLNQFQKLTPVHSKFVKFYFECICGKVHRVGFTTKRVLCRSCKRVWKVILTKKMIQSGATPFASSRERFGTYHSPIWSEES